MWQVSPFKLSLNTHSYKIPVIQSAEKDLPGIKMKDYNVYILTNEHGNVMYVGVTNHLERDAGASQSFG
jgi:hypothetical protein